MSDGTLALCKELHCIESKHVGAHLLAVLASILLNPEVQRDTTQCVVLSGLAICHN